MKLKTSLILLLLFSWQNSMADSSELPALECSVSGFQGEPPIHVHLELVPPALSFNIDPENGTHQAAKDWDNPWEGRILRFFAWFDRLHIAVFKPIGSCNPKCDDGSGVFEANQIINFKRDTNGIIVNDIVFKHKGISLTCVDSRLAHKRTVN